ncbi:hypothetical protein PBY51_003367 [Eleginops maclovinus]|uniref:Uncharacterized protein n=1 Tax=Eleginops maclovinus TaxID=56733 RepID=A0AAN8AKB4_ELEMC|nr:hypothetical protein PBY51_003367 [Eleginops maclovinus]
MGRRRVPSVGIISTPAITITRSVRGWATLPHSGGQMVNWPLYSSSSPSHLAVVRAKGGAWFPTSVAASRVGRSPIRNTVLL